MFGAPALVKITANDIQAKDFEPLLYHRHRYRYRQDLADLRFASALASQGDGDARLQAGVVGIH